MPDMDAAIQAIQGNDAATQALLGQERAQMAPAVAKASAAAEAPLPASPATEKAPTAPKQGDFGPDASAWMTAMTVFAGLAGGFSRKNAQTSLDAFSAGINGYREGNKAAFDQAHKQWEDGNKAALENNQLLRDKYEDVLKDRKLTEDEQLTKIQLIASQYHDQLTFNAAESKNMILIAKILESQEAAANRLIAENDKLKKKAEDLAAGLIPQEEMGELVDQYIQSGGADPSVMQRLKSRGNSSGNLKGFNAALKEKMADEQLTAADIANNRLDYTSDISEAHTIGTQSARLQTAGREADQLGDQAVAASAKVPRGDFLPFNELAMKVSEKTSNPEQAAYYAALNSYVNTYSRAINPNGVGTVAAQEHARDLLNRATSHEALVAVVDQLKKETQAARNSPDFVRTQLHRRKKDDAVAAGGDAPAAGGSAAGWSIEPVQ